MLYKSLSSFPVFEVERDYDKCIVCGCCVQQCTFDATYYLPYAKKVITDEHKCVGCKRCEAMCPTGAIKVRAVTNEFKHNAYWDARTIRDIYKQADQGGVILTGGGNDRRFRVYWDHLLIDACQVTNPSIDPLREPMELRTFLGRKPDALEVEYNEKGEPELKTKIAPNLVAEIPVIFAPMSYGALNLNMHKAMAAAADAMGTYWNTGEGSLHRDLYKYGHCTIVQVASGRFGVSAEYLKVAAAAERKIDQGAKPGIGGHLPGEKVDEEISKTRMIPVGTDALSPAPHHDIYSIEDLRQLIYAIKEATNYEKPVSVKIAAVHNVAAIASGIARAGADIIVLDGFRGGTGASPAIVRDYVGIPVEIAVAVVDQRLREEGIRNWVSIIAAGGIRNSADVIKAIALGADAVYIGTAALLAVGCTLCHKCYTGRCAWGITTNDPHIAKRLNPDIAAERLINLLKGWAHEMKEMLGLMGINAIESLKGNRLRLRAIGLTKEEMDILGVLPAGEGI